MLDDIPILECVPNFSEGIDSTTIAAIAEAAATQTAVRVLHIDAGKGANRTVITLAGTPDAVVAAAFAMIRQAAALIDLRVHTGAHARIGATDVCPLVPIQGISLTEAAELARQLGERVGRELNIPVYLYEAAATRPERQNLANIRRGEFAGLAAKMQHPDWLPDFGPATPHPTAGATVIGARDFLLAYNFNLNTADAALAQRIATQLRESGRLVTEATGKRQRIPGLCPGVKAIGWYMPEYACAQVSTNITNIYASPLHVVQEACRQLARQEGAEVIGAELVGMLPLSVMLAAGRFYQQGVAATEAELIAAAVAGLGLDKVRPFVPSERIIEYRLKAVW